MKRNVLIIGNGRSVLDAERGDEIDGFDGWVVRMNYYDISDTYKQYVGSKTDVLAIGNLDLTKKHPELFKRKYEYILLYQSSLDGGVGFRKVQEASLPTKVIFYPIEKKNKLLSAMCLAKNTNPTTGAVSIDWFNDPEITLFIYGIDCYQRSLAAYWDPTDPKRIESIHLDRYHDVLKEQEYINKLIAEDKIKLF
jgi:hypothetical protein